MYHYNHKGIYRVGNHSHTNKLAACLELNSINHNLKTQHQLHWDYHEDAFDQAPWQHEPPLAISDLYRERALQLRENYDHLVLFYSGGADSHTILHTFVSNNIHLDEVFLYGAFKAEEKMNQSLGLSRDPGYFTREVILIAKPTLEKLQKTHKFKITVWDWTDKTIQTLNNPDWFWDVGTRLAPDAVPRQYLHEAFRHNDRFEAKGKKVGFIFGVDKPRLFRDDQSVYFAFIDTMLTTAVGNNSDIHGRYWENDEYFYWTPNLPAIPIKQAHLIYNYLRQHNRLHELTHVNDQKQFHMAKYYGMIHPIVYPDWNNDTWQIKKSTNAVTDEFGKWFFDLAPDDSKHRWKDGILEVERLIGKQYFNDQTVWKGLVGCYSKFYRIGAVDQ